MVGYTNQLEGTGNTPMGMLVFIIYYYFLVIFKFLFYVPEGFCFRFFFSLSVVLQWQ